MQQPADIIIHTGALFDGHDRQDGRSIVIHQGDIIAVCSRDSASSQYAAARVIDAEGHFVMPGLIEGHGHLLLMGRLAQQIDLSSYDSWADIEATMVSSAADLAPGTWIIGHSWHQDRFSTLPNDAVDGYPSGAGLSAKLPSHPVYLQHASLHAALVNQAALKAAGVNDQIADPSDGRYVRDQQGQLTGMLLESAMKPVRDLVNALDTTLSHRMRAYAVAQQMCHRYGITSFHDAATTLDEMSFFKALAAKGQLDIHLYAMAYDDIDLLYAEGSDWPIRSRHLYIAAVKQFYDGALGSRTALLRRAYTDQSPHTGMRLLSASAVDSALRLCASHDLQYCVHAIGDLACTEVIDRIGAVMHDSKDHRTRIEHAQHVAAEDLDRMAQLEIIASVQPIHCSSDAAFLADRLGIPRAEATSFRWRSMVERGIHLALGTDVPVEPIQPFHNMYVACTRRPLTGGPAFLPDQALSRLETLRAYTSGNAFAARQASIRGRIAPGMAADIAVIDTDLLSCADSALLGAKALMTIYDGRVVYEHNTD